jgi:hypothetical protein
VGRDQGSRFGVQGRGFQLMGFIVWGLRFRVSGSGFRVLGFRFWFSSLRSWV